MKKFISLILSLALVACVFGMSVMAADEIVTVNKVGTHGDRAGTVDSFRDGIIANDFNDRTFYKSIAITLGTYESRYAVDIEFHGTYTFNISGLTWDVNKLEYVTSDSATATTITSNQNYKIKVVNYSDNSISVSATNNSNEEALDVAGLNVTFKTDIDDIVCSNCDENHTNCDFAPVDTPTSNSISGTLAGNTSGDTEANWVEFSAELHTNTDTSWDAAINALIEKYGAQEVVLTQFTVTVGKDTTTTEPTT